MRPMREGGPVRSAQPRVSTQVGARAGSYRWLAAEYLATMDTAGMDRAEIIRPWTDRPRTLSLRAALLKRRGEALSGLSRQ